MPVENAGSHNKNPCRQTKGSSLVKGVDITGGIVSPYFSGSNFPGYSMPVAWPDPVSISASL